MGEDHAVLCGALAPLGIPIHGMRQRSQRQDQRNGQNHVSHEKPFVAMRKILWDGTSYGIW